MNPTNPPETNSCVPAPKADPRPRIMAWSISLGLGLACVRGYIIAHEPEVAPQGLAFLRQTLAASCLDFLYAGVWGGVFLALASWPGRGQVWRRRWGNGFVVLALASFYVSLLNVPFILLLGRPFNYPWLYYSDYFLAASVQGVVVKYITWQLVLGCAASGAALLAVAWVMRKGLNRLAPWKPRWVLFAAAGLGIGLYAWWAAGVVADHGWERDRLQNPVVYFALSLGRTYQNPAIFTMATSVGEEDFLPVGQRAAEASTWPPQAREIVRNVVLYVWESVGAEHLEPGPGGLEAAPNLKGQLSRAAVFGSIYSPVPTSNKALVALLCSQYPWASYRSLTRDHSDMFSPSLADALRAAGHRTAYFSTGDIRFQRSDEYLRHRGFDLMEDYRDWPDQGRVFSASTEQWSYLDGGDEAATAERFLSWVDQAPDQPFFAMLWTTMTHYPYFSVGEEIDFGVKDAKHNRYLNAIHHTDAQLGRILIHLEARGLLASTLVIVVGDHGEAFGRHGQFGHGSMIYEENVRVPCVLIQPTLFHGQQSQAVGSLIDIAPTVTDILGLPPLPTWQGHSLFSAKRPPRAYFLAPWTDCWFGYREGTNKFLFNATSGRWESYDLAHDPTEQHNLAGVRPQQQALGLERLAAWTQHQNRFIASLIQRPKVANQDQDMSHQSVNASAASNTASAPATRKTRP